jgi:hypothetical protein
MKKLLLLSFLLCLSLSSLGVGELCEDPMEVPVILGELDFCEGEDLVLSCSVVEGATSYFWTGPNGLEESGTFLFIGGAPSSFSGSYTLRVVRNGGTACDTAYATVNVLIRPTSFVTHEHIMCPGDVYEYNGDYFTAQGDYYQVYTNMFGCDSTIMVIIDFFPIETAVEIATVNGSLVASGEGLTYQWIDCNNGGEPIAGATRSVFTPPTNGVYAVITTSTFCENVWTQSGCENFVGIDEFTSNQLQIFPNPFKDFFTIQNDEIIAEIRITDLSGRLIYQSFPSSTMHQCNLSDVGEGLFIVRVFMAGGKAARLVTRIQ